MVAAAGAASALLGRGRHAPCRNLGRLPKDLERIERVIEPEIQATARYTDLSPYAAQASAERIARSVVGDLGLDWVEG